MVEELSHFIQGIMLITDWSQGLSLSRFLRRTALAEADPNLTILSVRTMQQQIDLLIRSGAGCCTPRATVLDCRHWYWLPSEFTVSRSTWSHGRPNEIGIRMALDGADRVKAHQFLLRQAFRARGWSGFLLGLPSTVGAARFMAAQLYGVNFWDPFALTISAVGSLAVCAFVAAILPASRAAAIQPMTALRAE